MTHRTTGWNRWLAWLMALIMCASVLTLPAFAAAEADDADASESEEAPLVNVIGTEDGEENGSTDGEPAAAETESADTGSSETGETDEAPAGGQTDTPAEGGESEEPAGNGDSAEPTDPETGTEDSSEDTTEDTTEDPSGEPEAPYTVSYYLGEDLLDRELVKAGEKPANVPTKNASGTPIKGWKDADGAIVAPAELAVEADVSYFAWTAPALVTEEHIRYIKGKGEGLFQPTASLTRAEAATILYNLLQTTARGPLESSFSDVTDSAWYAEQVKTLASYGVLNGYPDGTFRPNRPVTRAEFVTMIVNLTGGTGTQSNFTDVAGSWAIAAIEAAVSNGWIFGYEEKDGTYTFRPAREITRAEAVIIVNRVLGRSADGHALETGSGILHYLDVDASMWYYDAIMEASIRHSYTRTADGETWTDYTVESSGLKQGVYTSGSTYYYIDGNGQPVYMKKGLTEADGRFFYSPTAGYYFTGDLSSKAGYCVFADGSEQKLTTGFNRIDTKKGNTTINSTLFYWDLNSASAKKLNKGINFIGSTAYWADEAGYVIRNNFGAGVVELDGKKYLSRGRCDIVTSGEGYVSATSKPSTIDLKNQTLEFSYDYYDENNVKRTSEGMYYLKSDYSLACNEWVGYLYFGKDCMYTSGDSALDGYVWTVVKDFINNNALTKEQKLLRGYYYLRGGSGENWTYSQFKYRAIMGEGYIMKRYNQQQHIQWCIDSAKRMYTVKNGMCYEWAAAYLFIARRLGFQAYPVVGTIGNTTARHCWCMIKWDGKWHISDVEIEWGWLSGWYGGDGVKLYRNLFSQTVSNEYFVTYTNPECGLTYYYWEEEPWY